MSVRATIIEQVRTVAQQQGKTLPELRDDLPILDSGLDSLCIAILVATLEDLLRLDPFSSEKATELPVTLGDFIRMYETEAAP